MKTEDKITILPPSPISVLESTRKDFEALLESANSSSDDGKARKTKQIKQVRRQRLKKQEKHHASATEPMEMREFTSSKSSVKHNLVEVKSTAHTNPTFWYEDEQESATSHSSVCSEKSELQKTSSRHTISSAKTFLSTSSVKQEVAIHESPYSTQISSSDEGSEKPLSIPHRVSQSRSSIASSYSQVSKADNHKRIAVSPKSPEESPSSLDHQEEEVNSDIEESAESSSSVHSILKLTVHQSDRLILDQPKTQPLVVVHAVNCKTGRYIVNNGVPIPPQFTGALIHQMFKSNALPEWNQEMVFELDADKYLSETVFLFELVSEPNITVSSLLAWGFLRPISRTGVKHMDKKLQLQLYKIPVRRLFNVTSRPNVSDLYSWFNSAQKEKYPATLHVTLLLISSNSPSASKSFSKSKRTLITGVSSPLRGNRLSGQPFKLPTRRGFTFDAAAGALMASYTSDGSFLAVALTNGDILVFEDSAKSLHLKGHQGNVYDIHWDTKDRESAWRLLSCGADCTARVWNESNDIILPHPAYVYCARFAKNNRIVTGCYDHSIRLWELNSTSPRLLSSYVQHTAPINSICWDSHGKLFSADTRGCICVWKSDHAGLCYDRILNESSDEYRNQTPVNCITFHPSGARLLVHYRGSNLCLLEPKSGLKLISYNGIYNPRLRLTSSISPCGGFVVSGSEDGSVHWFDLERGDLVAITTLPSSTNHPIMAVAFHPTDHAVAFCSLNSEYSLAVLEFNKSDTQVYGFSMITFPRTVQSAVSPIENISRNTGISQQTKTTPTLDKLERIFRKLDLVMAWSDSHRQTTENEENC